VSGVVDSACQWPALGRCGCPRWSTVAATKVWHRRRCSPDRRQRAALYQVSPLQSHQHCADCHRFGCGLASRPRHRESILVKAEPTRFLPAHSSGYETRYDTWFETGGVLLCVGNDRVGGVWSVGHRQPSSNDCSHGSLAQFKGKPSNPTRPADRIARRSEVPTNRGWHLQLI
jgi:hypothetical protein